MLVLTRKPREEIRIGNGITITVLRVKGQSVRIGIDAPNDIRIVRGELNPETVGTAKEDVAEQQKFDVESPVNAADESLSNDSASKHRCEQSARPVRSESSSIAPCPSRMSKPRRTVSSLKSLVARNRAASAANRPTTAPGSGPPR